MLEALGWPVPDASGKTPDVLYAAIKNLPTRSGNVGGHAGKLQISYNVRPSLEVEDLAPASHELASLVMKLRQKQIKGIDELNLWSAGIILPTAYARGRMIRFLSKLYDSTRGLLSVNVGASATSVAAGFAGELTLGVYPQFGLGENLAGILQYTEVEDIMRWLQLDISPNTLREYLFQKSFTLPPSRPHRMTGHHSAIAGRPVSFSTSRKRISCHAVHGTV